MARVCRIGASARPKKKPPEGRAIRKVKTLAFSPFRRRRICGDTRTLIDRETEQITSGHE